MTASTRVFRAPLRSRRADVDGGAAVERALTHGLCGIGGVLASPPAALVAAAEQVAARYDERMARRLERFAAAPEGAFVWTRDAEGLFWLGRLGGGWRYDGSADAAGVDLVHVRPCTWLDAPIPDGDVPPGVHRTFARGGRNWQEIHDGAVGALTSGLWNESQRTASAGSDDAG
ncbi:MULTISPECIES: GAF domain-containing protein [Microbacterium]|uniref:GAF domain-containing protein n=1 Tax=Microbacterium wangchenii TaxID=2541726 RepID=A0ABX5SQI9_9MICO|nr:MULTISPECIES: GAF domain-containing protein [Microbacterium]MCK6064935.1 GAF domain-containing protein [Microbacterium sp. EYE_512]QBR88413.1 GAF domain-containing protein [Microbacterium wangchenii]TXK20140.1 GAF domain-containing protein [Microbacterium wangchenii]